MGRRRLITLLVGFGPFSTGISVLLMGTFCAYPAPAQRNRPFTDPVTYCRAVGTVDNPRTDRRYSGPRSTRALLRAPGLQPDQADTLVWRCMNGTAFVCANYVTMGSGCIKAPWTNAREWNYLLRDSDVRAECRRVVRAQCAGGTHCVIGCASSRPIINTNSYPVDARGFARDEWRPVR
jgi:hypothetical protein